MEAARRVIKVKVSGPILAAIRHDAFTEAAAKLDSMAALYGAYAERRLAEAAAPKLGRERRRLLGEADEFTRDAITLADAARAIRELEHKDPA